MKSPFPKWVYGDLQSVICSHALWLAIGIAVTVGLALAIATPSRAMPEYATQLGEPCATCHISPAGGGLRTARGQAWVASDKPGAVPSIEEAMKLLGVKATVNPADYLAAPLPRPTPGPLGREEGPGVGYPSERAERL